jgi:DNA-binding CsgD family transcriptional regulator
MALARGWQVRQSCRSECCFPVRAQACCAGLAARTHLTARRPLIGNVPGIVRTVPFSTAGDLGGLLERERELRMLRAGLSQACAGDGSLLLIEGPPGVGKTALIRGARAQAEQAGILPLEATGSELEQPFAFGVVRQLLEPVIRQQPTGTDLFAGGAAPAARLFEPDDHPPNSADIGFEALHSLYWLMVNIADHTPVLVSVDDCQWADRDSLRFLAYLAQRIEGLGITTLLASRPPDLAAEAEAGSLWAQLASRPAAIALYPPPLSEPATINWTRQHLRTDADEEFCRACHTATGGNPLFLRELLRTLDAQGIEPSAAAASQVQAVGPAAVRRFVLHRLAALGPAAASLARAVAVLGDDSEVTLAAQVAGMSPDAARQAADALVRAGLFNPAERLGYVHPVVRAALYEDLAPGERQARHAAAARILADAGAPTERVTAHLLLTAPNGDPQRVTTLRSAAASAARRGAPRAAAARLQRALAESPAEQERAEILAELGRCEVATLQFESAQNHLQACLTSGAALATRADAASMLGRCTIVSGGRSAQVAADALAQLAEELHPLDRERSLELASELLMLTTAVSRLRPSLPAQLTRFDELSGGHPGFAAIARVVRAQERFFHGGSAADSVAQIQAVLSAGLPSRTQTDALLIGLLTLRYAEQYDLAMRLLEIALEGARREGHTTRQGLIHGQRAMIALARGSIQDAQVEAETGLLLVEKPHFAVVQLVAVAIGAHIERGELDTADALATRIDPATIAEDGTYVPAFLDARGCLRIAQGRSEDGVADLLWCGRLMEESRGLPWPGDWRVHAAPALSALGRSDLASQLAREQLALARRVRVPGALGMSLRAAGLVAGGAEGQALLFEAVAVLEHSPARLELAHALADLGAQLSRAHRRAEGRDALRRAIKLAGECGALALAEGAMAELHAGPGRRARTELTGPTALTAAEWRVCREAVAGQTNRELAQALFVTEKTIERHLSSAYAKLGIRSRFQLAAAIGE